MLNWIVKGLMQWLYGMAWQMGEYIMNALMDVFHMDMAYFKTAVPISETIMNIMFGVGWALLLGNLVFQAAKSMMSGLGFEGDDPCSLGLRTFVFAFLLVCSRQICEVGLSIGATVNDLLQVPNSVILPSMTDDMFSIDASWFLVMIVGIILLFQLIKFFFEVGERYVIVGVLTILSPLAFAMGGSRNTMEIFKGWVRMYGSMCLMLIMNTVFMKLIVSAMAIYPRGLDVFPWLILVIGLARVARKIDSIIARIGLNPAITGDGLGRGFPGMMALMVGRQIISSFAGAKMGAGKAAAGAAKDAASGAAGRASGFTGGARPAPSPVNTNPAAGRAGATPGATPGAAGAGAASVNMAGATAAGTVNPMNVNPSGGSSVNPPIRGTGTSTQTTGSPSPQNAGKHRTGTKQPPLYGSPANGGNTRSRSGITISADDDLPRRHGSDGAIPKPPQASRLGGSSPTEPLGTSKNTGIAGAQGSGSQEKPTRPPRGSSEVHPVDAGKGKPQPVHHSGVNTSPATPAPIQSGSNAPSEANVQPGSTSRQSSIHNGGVSPVQTHANDQSVQQGARAQVSSVSSQGGMNAQSQAQTTQEGSRVQQSVQQNTQNMTRGGSASAPQPVHTQAVGNTSAGATPSASRQQAAPTPTSTTAAQAGKSGKTQAPKPVPKAASASSPAQTPKTPKPVDIRKKPEPSKQKQIGSPHTPGTAGKNQAPTPIDIGTDADKTEAAILEPETETPNAVTDHE